MISSELYSKIFEYVEGSITAQQLEEWLVPRLPIFLESPDSEDSDIVATIELGLAQMSEGIRTRDEFLNLLRDVVQQDNVILTSYPTTDEYLTSGSTNQTSQVTIDFIVNSVPTPP